MWNTGSRQIGPYWLRFGDIAGSLVWSHICSVKCKVLSCPLLLGCHSGIDECGWVDGCSLLYLGRRTDGWNYPKSPARLCRISVSKEQHHTYNTPHHAPPCSSTANNKIGGATNLHLSMKQDQGVVHDQGPVAPVTNCANGGLISLSRPVTARLTGRFQAWRSIFHRSSLA